MKNEKTRFKVAGIAPIVSGNPAGGKQVRLASETGEAITINATADTAAQFEHGKEYFADFSVAPAAPQPPAKAESKQEGK